jgi:hypothetical protein
VKIPIRTLVEIKLNCEPILWIDTWGHVYVISHSIICKKLKINYLGFYSKEKGEKWKEERIQTKVRRAKEI